MKALAHTVNWWLKFDTDIEEMVKGYNAWILIDKTNATSSLSESTTLAN